MRIKFILIFLSISLCAISFAQTVHIHHTTIPVLIDRKYNVISEFNITHNKDITMNEVKVRVEGLNPSAVKSVKLIYSGTASVLMSRTKSALLHERQRLYGSAHDTYCHPAYTMELASGRLDKNGVVTLTPHKRMMDGINFMYVSIEVKGKKVRDISKPFTVEVERLMIDGRAVRFEEDGNKTHRLGVSLRTHNDDKVYAYRIPGLVTTNEGSLIAVYDARYTTSFDLQDHIDVAISRSTDDGKTWGKMKVIMDMGEFGGLPKGQNGVGDPSILVDEKTGEIFVVALWTCGQENRHAFWHVKQGYKVNEASQLLLASSKDDGKTWSEPVNITRQVKDSTWRMTLQGPGRGISMKDGTLVFPMQRIDSSAQVAAGVMYSKDHGKTWHCHNMAVDATTEAQVVEVEDGILMLNMRNNKRTGRMVYTTDDLGKTWKEHPSSGDLIEPVCMASIIKLTNKDPKTGKNILLFSNPERTDGRRDMTIKASLDGGLTWNDANKLLLDEEFGWGYSCMSQIDEETVGIVYEGSNAHLVYQQVRIDDIIN